MADTPTPVLPSGLIEAKQRLEERRQRLDRIAQRYEQLETALEDLELLADQYLLEREPQPGDLPSEHPRKPR